MVITIWILSVVCVILLILLITLCNGDEKHYCGIINHKSKYTTSYGIDTQFYFHILLKHNTEDQVRKIEVSELAFSKFEIGDHAIIRK